MAFLGASIVLATLAAQGEAAFQRTHDDVAPARPAGGSQPSRVNSVAVVKSLNHGDHVNQTHFTAHALAGDCGRPEIAAVLASMATFDSGLVYDLLPENQVNELKQKLASAGFTQAKRVDVSTGNCTKLGTQDTVRDSDAAVLWKRDNHCLLAFRGSNCMADGFSASPASMFKYGHDINRDVLVKEFEPLVALMEASDFSDCSSLDVTGFSLGGSLATIFAVLNNADELHFGKTVTGLYALAPVPTFYGDMVTNQKSTDGCFAGGVYCNYVTEQGALKVDPACVNTGYAFPKAAFVKIGAATGETACASVTKNIVQDHPADALLPAHFPQLYINNMGCDEAALPFNAAKFCKRPAMAPFCR